MLHVLIAGGKPKLKRHEVSKTERYHVSKSHTDGLAGSSAGFKVS